MTQLAMNYGKILFDLSLSEECVNHCKEVFQSSELVEALENPAVKATEKSAVIDSVFNKAITNFIKVLCDNNYISNISQIFEAYDEVVLNSNNMIKATIAYVTNPSSEHIEKIKQMICTEYKKTDVIFELKEEPALIGGFILSVGDKVYDSSIKGRLLGLQKILCGGE